ncbi:MAG TPA: ABC transporter ATP-binding protein [Acidimicrobiia bacterium]|nr:ABC transporter ATP-binding protein [Acidimicrobiia bacterium]
MGSLVLEVEGLRKAFGDLLAVDGVGFWIEQSETYGLLGPNGAGKTTSISMIAGLLEADAGSVRIAGETMTTTSIATKNLIGLVPQELAIYPDLTGRENLWFFGRLYGLGGSDLTARVDEVLEVIGLSDRAGDRAKEYSGGMQRRLNIGIGLLHRPRLLILDEPTVGVDPQSRNAILSSVENLAVEGLAVLYTTHYMEEAERLCDRVGIIDEGRIKAEGTRRELTALVGGRDIIRLGASGTLDGAVDAIGRLDVVQAVTPSDGGIDVVSSDGSGALPAILGAAAGAGAYITSVEITEPDLESVFLHLTGKALRD